MTAQKSISENTRVSLSIKDWIYIIIFLCGLVGSGVMAYSKIQNDIENKLDKTKFDTTLMNIRYDIKEIRNILENK